jgi:hypothetical protein
VKIFSDLWGRFLDAGGFSDASWKKKTFYVFLLALLAWTAALSFWSDAEELRARRVLQRGRYNDLVSVLREYSALRKLKGGEGSANAPVAAVAGEDLLTVVSNVVSSLGLRENMISLSASAARGGASSVSLTLEGVSGENLARFLQEIDRRSIEAFSADLRAARASDEKRTLTVYLMLGASS